MRIEYDRDERGVLHCTRCGQTDTNLPPQLGGATALRTYVEMMRTRDALIARAKEADDANEA